MEQPSTSSTPSGWRGFVLKVLPRNYIQTPSTQEIPIPRWNIGKISENVAEWQIQVQQKSIDVFLISVYGKCYRLATKETLLPKKTPSLFDTDTSQLQNPTPVDAPIRTPYSELYDLLYPPPEDFVSDTLPQYEKLYSFQKEGVAFLARREHALLADDMGLGKTVQCSLAITTLMKSERASRVLIVCPRSLTTQWQRELVKWGGISATLMGGYPESRPYVWKNRRGVLLATPQIVINDIEVIKKQEFDLVVCDDISMLKNPTTKFTEAINSVFRHRSWCLNGTPLENKPEDLPNVMQFVYPGLFSAKERHSAPPSSDTQRIVKPYFLRRTKEDKLVDLPEKVTTVRQIEMSSHQWKTYRNIEQHEWDTFSSESSKTKLHIFAIITRLIQQCNYDKYSENSKSIESAKAKAIEEDLNTMPDGAKAIIFSRFVDTLEYLSTHYHEWNPILYSGQLSAEQRDKALREFEQNGKLLLMSTMAGARGINLQCANYVFHFDLSWNPVHAMQAEARCHRHGQQKTVFVYKYLQQDTIEERIHEVIEHKINLFQEYVSTMEEVGDAQIIEKLSMDELISILKPQGSKRR